MKVALVGPYPVDISKIRGGVEAATFYLAQGLKEIKNIDLHVISTTKEISIDETKTYGNITVHYIAEPRSRIIPNLVTNIERIRITLDKLKPDIVHGEHPCGTLAGIKGNYPTVHTIHGVIHKEILLARSINEFFAQALLGYLTNKAVKNVRFAIAVSEYAKAQYLGRTSADIVVIPNTVEDSFFSIEDNEIHDRMLTVGYVGKRKNTIGLVNAFYKIKSANPNAELVIAGAIKDRSYFCKVTAILKLLHLEDSVHFTGFISQNELEREYAKASLVCMYSLEESFAITLSQGMAAGKAVIATNSGGPAYVVVDGKTGYLTDINREDDFVEKTLMLLSDKSLRKNMGDEGRRIALENYSKEVVAKQTFDVYKKLLQI